MDTTNIYNKNYYDSLVAVCHDKNQYTINFNRTIIGNNQKFLYPKGDNSLNVNLSTDNIMSYSGERKSTWKWQWDIIKKNER